jgi:hypothetical protein
VSRINPVWSETPTELGMINPDQEISSLQSMALAEISPGFQLDISDVGLDPAK